MREVLRAGMAALTIAGCAGNQANHTPESAATNPEKTGAPTQTTSHVDANFRPAVGHIQRDKYGCWKDYPPASGPLDEKFPELTAKACLSNEFLNVDDLRAHCAAQAQCVTIHVGFDVPHWECDPSCAEIGGVPESE